MPECFFIYIICILSKFCRFFIYSLINAFQILQEFLLIFGAYILDGITNLMYNTKLYSCIGINTLDRFRKTFQSVYTGYKNIFFLYFGLFPYGFELNNDSLLILIDFYGHSFIIDSLFRLISFVTFTSYDYSYSCGIL